MTVLAERLECAAGLCTRRLGRDDADAVASMVRRCSEESLYRRLLGTHDAVRALASPVASGAPLGRVDVGAYAGSELIGLGSLVPGPDGDWDVAVLVEDAWQGRGAGSRLADALAREARAARVPAIRVSYLGINRRVARMVSARTRDVGRRRTEAGLIERRVVPRDVHARPSRPDGPSANHGGERA